MTYVEEYNKSDIFCPHCGVKNVWLDQDEDYYLGHTGLCLSCGKYHHCAGDFFDYDENRLTILQEKTGYNENE